MGSLSVTSDFLQESLHDSAAGITSLQQEWESFISFAVEHGFVNECETVTAVASFSLYRNPGEDSVVRHTTSRREITT